MICVITHDHQYQRERHASCDRHLATGDMAEQLHSEPPVTSLHQERCHCPPCPPKAGQTFWLYNGVGKQIGGMTPFKQFLVDAWYIIDKQLMICQTSCGMLAHLHHVTEGAPHGAAGRLHGLLLGAGGCRAATWRLLILTRRLWGLGRPGHLEKWVRSHRRRSPEQARQSAQQRW